MRCFISRIERIQGGVDSVEHRDGMKGDRVFRTIRAEDSEHVAFPESSFRQARCRAPDRISQLTVGQTAASRAINQGSFVFKFEIRFENEVGERNFRNRHIVIWSAKDHYRFWACSTLAYHDALRFGVPLSSGNLVSEIIPPEGGTPNCALKERSVYTILLTKRQQSCILAPTFFSRHG